MTHYTSSRPRAQDDETAAASLQRRVVGLARKVALSHNVPFGIVHHVLNRTVGVDRIDDCTAEDLGHQLVLAKKWLKTGIEPRPGDYV